MWREACVPVENLSLLTISGHFFLRCLMKVCRACDVTCSFSSMLTTAAKIFAPILIAFFAEVLRWLEVFSTALYLLNNFVFSASSRLNMYYFKLVPRIWTCWALWGTSRDRHSGELTSIWSTLLASDCCLGHTSSTHTYRQYKVSIPLEWAASVLKANSNCTMYIHI